MMAYLDMTYSESDRSVLVMWDFAKNRLDRIYLKKFGETFTEMQRRLVQEMTENNLGKDI